MTDPRFGPSPDERHALPPDAGTETAAPITGQAVELRAPTPDPVAVSSPPETSPPETAATGATRDDTGTAQQAEQQFRTLAAQLNLPQVQSLAGREPSADFLQQFEIGFARRHSILALSGRSAAAGTEQAPTREAPTEVALCDADGWAQLDTIGRVLRRRVVPLVAPRSQILVAVNHAYQQRHSQTQQLIDSLDQRSVLSEIEQLAGREDLLDTTGLAPVIKLVNLILFEAVKSRASDVHVQPREECVVVRQRIDGVLFDSLEIPKALQEEVLTRIKVLGGMNIAEKRLPQDGRATVQVGDRVVDLRIASLPTSHNERIVIRLLDKSARLYTLGELGMPSVTLRQFQQLIQLDHGLILVTGPTGSGKSTTLYAALQEINTIDQNVLTLEDPIEYQLEGISQTQINEKKGMTFASGLRSVLRQDPDIIMVGEIRDQETAVMAIQASLTGHLVFSTLHTNDAASAVTRLLDLGIEPYLVSSSLVAALAQRLVRRICAKCSQPLPQAQADQELSRLAPRLVGRSVRQGRGCQACRQTGYRGRVGIFEFLVVDDAVRDIVQGRGNATKIRQTAIRSGMALLCDDGLDKVAEGQTTIAEVMRVARSDDLAIFLSHAGDAGGRP